MCEIWKDVIGYEGLYQVSSLGKVKSLARESKRNTFKEKILNPHLDGRGYPFVALYRNNVPKQIKVHKLVATAFLDNPENKPTVNHIDEDKTNNTAENLEWATFKENANHGTRNQRIASANRENHNRCAKQRKPVDQYDINGYFMNTWNSASAVADFFKINRSEITQCCKGKRKQCKNYFWKYHLEVI